MTTRILRSPDDIERLATFLGMRNAWPITVTIAQGASRRDAQNRLAQRWFTDISRQRGDTTHNDVRADCKVRFGVQILRAENEAFRIVWDRRFGNLSYEEKREIVRDLDIPVTRLMNVKQMSAFMDAVQSYWTAKGFWLTDPEALKYESEFR